MGARVTGPLFFWAKESYAFVMGKFPLRPELKPLAQTMKKLLALPLILLAAAPAALAQSPTTSAQKIQMCQAVRMANQDGISGKFMLEEMLARRGQPKYLAKVIMNDIKPVCPNAY